MTKFAIFYHQVPVVCPQALELFYNTVFRGLSSKMWCYKLLSSASEYWQQSIQFVTFMLHIYIICFF